MKKIVIVLMIALLLTGCGKHDAKISNSEDVIWTENGHDFKSSDLFEDLKAQDYTGIIIRNIIENIATFENIDTATVKTNADADVDSILDAYGEYYFQYYGYTVDEYRKSYYGEALLTELMKIYIDGQFDFYVDDYTPYKAEIAYFDNIDTANKIVDDVTSGEHTFEYSCLENGYNNEITEQVYTDQSDLPLEVKEYVINTDMIGLSDVIQSSTIATDAEGNATVTPRYYLVNITSKNVNDYKDEFVNWLISNAIDSNEVLNNYMTKYNLKIHDQKTYELIKESYGDYH